MISTKFICDCVLIFPLRIPRYPPDDPLIFEKLPGLASLDIKEEMEEEEKNGRYVLEKTSHDLGVAVDIHKDWIDKAIDTYNDICKLQKGICDSKKQAVTLIKSKIDLAQTYK